MHIASNKGNAFAIDVL